MIRLSPYDFKENQWAELKDVSFNLPKLQCHRGYCVNGARENSVDSIQRAFDQGYTMVEMDLRLNRDGQIVLFHDKILPETDVSQASSFEEVLDLLPKNCFYNLEIKNESKIVFSLEEKLIKDLKNHPKKNQLLFSSFNPLSLAWMAKLLPDIPRALLVTQEKGEPGNSILLRELSLLPLVKPHFLNLRWQDLDHYRNIPFERKVVWTLNDLSHAQNLLISEKIVSVITDHILPSEIVGF